MPCTRSAKLPSTRDSSASASKSPDLLRKECENGGPPKGFRRGGAAGAAPDVGGPCASHLRPALSTLVSPGGGTSVYLARGIREDHARPSSYLRARAKMISSKNSP